MRKTFLTFCVAALSLLAVSSCGKIWDEFDSVNAEIEALKAKVTALENKLNEEVARINAALDVELVFSVDPETFEVSVSYDGGQTFVATGIIANDSLVEVQWEEGSDEIILVIGGTPYSIPVYKEDNSSLVLGKTEFFLQYEGTKAIQLTAEGISEYYVMAKPDGWRAFMLDETTLWVIAPTYKQLAAEAAEEEGEILIHATTEAGKCKVAKISVTTGPGLTLELLKGGNVFITNAFAGEEFNMWGDSMGYNFTNFFVGFATDPESFKADPAAYLGAYEEQYSFPNYDPSAMFYNNYNMEFRPYEEGVYEIDEITANIADLYSWMAYSELEYGSSFVFWICGVDAQGMPDPRTVQYVDYTHMLVDIEVSGVSHNDATLNLNLGGATKYFIGYVDAWFEESGMTLQDYMESSTPWMYLVNGYAEYIDDYAVVDGEYEIKLSELYGDQLMFGTKYYAWVFPYTEGAVYSDYATQFAPYVVEFTTNDVTAGGSYEVEFGKPVTTYSSIEVDVDFSEGVGSVFYDWFAEEDFNFENDAELVEALFASYQMPLTEAETVSKDYLNPGVTYYLAAVAVGEDGVYGAPASVKCSTLSVPYDESITVDIVSCVLDEAGKTYTVTVNVEGASKIMGYNITDSEYNRSVFPNNVAMNGHKSTYYGYQMVAVENGQAVFTFPYSSYKKDYYVAAYNVEDGIVSSICAEFDMVHLFD